MAEYQASDLEIDIDFTSHVDGDREKDKLYLKATVCFSTLEAMREAGGESVKRILQTGARNGKFPVGRRVRVDEHGKFTLTAEEEIAAMDPEKAMRQYELLKARFEATKSKK